MKWEAVKPHAAPQSLIWGSDETEGDGKWVSFVTFQDWIAPFILLFPLSFSPSFSPDSSSLSYNYQRCLGICNESKLLDIIDLCLQLPSNSQLLNTVPAPLLPEVVQRETGKVELSSWHRGSVSLLHVFSDFCTTTAQKIKVSVYLKLFVNVSSDHDVGWIPSRSPRAKRGNSNETEPY